MYLKSFGCSFMFGTDLKDIHQGINGLGAVRLMPSQSTWPAHLASHLNYKYRCYAQGGSGNLQTLERVLNHAAIGDMSLFVINWTWVDRFDYYVDNPALFNDPGKNAWQTITPTDTTESSKIYYRDLHSEYRDKLVTLSYIRLAIDTLTQKNMPFIMTYMDDLLFDQQWHVNTGIIDLQKYVQPHMTTFEGQNLLDWSRKNGYPISETWHPLEEAHQSAADYIIKVFDKQNTTDH